MLRIKKWFYKNKSYIIIFFIGGIFFSTISVSAAIMIAAKEVSLSTSKTSKTNVQDSLDELYDLVTYGNVSASQMLSGTTALSNGKKITGTISSKGAATFTPSTSNQTIAAGQYLSGAQTIKGDSNLVAGNIKSGVSLFGVTGTYTGSENITILDLMYNDAQGKSLSVQKGDYVYTLGFGLSGVNKTLVKSLYKGRSQFIYKIDQTGTIKVSDCTQESCTYFRFRVG